MILEGGANIYGYSIGVLSLESAFCKIPGHIKNTTTFNFPITYKIVKGAVFDTIAYDKKFLSRFVDAAKELEDEGVKAITGSCGFLVLLQNEIAEAVSVPVYISSLVQVPLVSRIIGTKKKVGVMVASKEALTIEHLKAVGAENIPVCIGGMDNAKEFNDVITHPIKLDLDIDLLEQEIVEEAVKLSNENPDMGAMVLECTDMPQFAYKIQQRIKKPIFDIVTLTNMVHETLFRRDYSQIRY